MDKARIRKIFQNATPGEWEVYDDRGLVSIKSSNDDAICTDVNKNDAELMIVAKEIVEYYLNKEEL